MDKQKFHDLIIRFKKTELVIFGGSAGSFMPIFNLIRSLPQAYAKAIVIVIHRGKNNFSDIENLFSDNCRILVSEITDKDKLTGGNVYIAPANYHTLFEKSGNFALDVSESVWYSKPSIDVTFESAADSYGAKCTAILFSGANQDGAGGLLKLKKSGALTIIQQPADAEMSIMPQAAVDMDAGEYILTIDQITELMRETTSTQPDATL